MRGSSIGVPRPVIACHQSQLPHHHRQVIYLTLMTLPHIGSLRFTDRPYIYSVDAESVLSHIPIEGDCAPFSKRQALRPWVTFVPSMAAVHLEQQPNRHHTLSPIEWIPEEIIMEIIKAEIEHKPTISFSPGSTGVWDRWRYAHVCRLWRAVTFSCHSLWSNLRISFSPNKNRRGRIHKMIAEVISRAGSCPLTLTLYWDSKGYGALGIANRKLLDLLISRHLYWQTVEITLPKTYLSMLARLMHSRPMPMLRSLCVATSPPGHLPSQLYRLMNSVAAPNLCRVDLGNGLIDYKTCEALLSLPLPWTTLDSFIIHSGFPDMDLAFAHRTPNVIEFEATHYADDLINRSLLPLSLRRVRRARFDGTAPTVIAGLYLPNLEVLELINILDAPLVFRSCSELLRRSCYPQIHEMSLTGLINERDMAALSLIWKYFPSSICTLRIGTSLLADSYWETWYNSALICSITAAASYLKNLQKIFITVKVMTDRPPFKELLDMVLALKLQSLRTFGLNIILLVEDGATEADVENDLLPFFALRKEGLMVDISWQLRRRIMVI
jgi:hypothetical protein